MLLLEGLIRGVHDLSAGLWVGSLTMLLAVVMPSFSQRGDATLLLNLQKRMVKLLRPVIAVVVVTGLLAMRRALVEWNGGLPPGYTAVLIAKLLITAAMVGVALRRQWWLHTYAFSRPRQGMLLLVVNTSLGWITMILSGILTVLGDAGG